MTRTVLLGDIAEINMGQSPKSEFYNTEGEGLPFMQGVRTFGRMYPVIDTWCVKPTKTADEGDILFSVRAPVGDLNFATSHMCIGRGLASLKSRNNKFLYYLLEANKDRLISSQTGSVFGSVNATILKNFRLTVPENTEEQDEIANILWTIDEKIELNRQMNETLEQMGQALFRHYFIDNLEVEKWEEETLGDIIELRGGLSYKAGFLSDSATDTPMVTMGCVSGKYRINLGALKYYSGEYKAQHILNPGDMFIATRDVTQDRVLIGSPAIIPKSLGQAICATNLYRVIKMQDISTEFLYQLMRTRRYRKQIIANAKGSTIVMLTKDSVLDFTFRANFDSTSYREYVQYAEVLRQKIDRNSEEIQTLTTLRDALLPRLISGKVKVR